MNIYNYDKVNKEFLSTSVAIENPLEKGNFLIPASATKVEPLQAKIGFAVCFNEQEQVWEYIEDYRGEESFSIKEKSLFVVDYIGSIKDGFTLLKPKDYDVWDNENKCWVEDSELKLKFLELSFTNAIQEHLDTIAQKTKWDNMQSARAAAGIPLLGNESEVEVAMHTDAVKLARWYLKVWAYGYAQLDIINKGEREVPASVEEFISELPILGV